MVMVIAKQGKGAMEKRRSFLPTKVKSSSLDSIGRSETHLIVCVRRNVHRDIRNAFLALSAFLIARLDRCGVASHEISVRPGGLTSFINKLSDRVDTCCCCGKRVDLQGSTRMYSTSLVCLSLLILINSVEIAES